MSATTKTPDPATVTARERQALRTELTEQYDYLTRQADQFSTSNEVIKQFVTTAIQGIDAINRVLELADKLAPVDDTSPLGNIGYAIAQEIREAVRGQ